MAVITTSLVPDVGNSGVWSLTAPYDALINATASYKCLEVRQLQGIIAAGGDPYSLYYVPQEGDTPGSLKDQYASDLSNGACIVTLQSSSGSVVYVPTTFIASFPAGGGIAYHALMLAVDIGVLPEYVDLTFLKQQMANLVKTTVGLPSVAITTVVVSPTTNLSLDDHNRAEAARKANITNTVTPEAQVIALTKQLQSVQQAYATLEQFVQDNIDKLSGTTPPANPSDQLDASLVPAGITLSNGNLTATSTAAGWESVRGTVEHTAGKYYAEATIGTLVGSVAFGICNANQLTSSEVGGDTNGISIQTLPGGADAGVRYNGAIALDLGVSPAAGQTVGIAIDLNAKLAWFYNPATQKWNGDVIANQNPATGVGGLPLASIAVAAGAPQAVYLGVSVDAVTDALTINAGASAWANALPSGFNPWNTAS
ncbi:hypothetical protein [Burkholderia phage FLC9]|nr:hypothetical protein [Burkholderia phage FLC9]